MNNNTAKNKKMYGPTIPSRLNNEIKTLKGTNISKSKTYGAQLPPHMQCKTNKYTEISDNMNEEMVGPLPSTNAMDKPTASEIELSTRALQIKLKNIEGVTSSNMSDTTREEWMLELPEINQNKNLVDVPRSFQMKERPDFTDRSSWTNTPHSSTKHKKSLTNKEIYKRNIAIEKDKEQDLLAKKHKKIKRDKSLLQLHEEKYQNEKKKKQIKNERRPFNRDLDIQVTRFDQTKKSALIKNAQLLDTKFSTGKTKYL